MWRADALVTRGVGAGFRVHGWGLKMTPCWTRCLWCSPDVCAVTACFEGIDQMLCTVWRFRICRWHMLSLCLVEPSLKCCGESTCCCAAWICLKTRNKCFETHPKCSTVGGMTNSAHLLCCCGCHTHTHTVSMFHVSMSTTYHSWNMA
jgi:hypothetical protein